MSIHNKIVDQLNKSKIQLELADLVKSNIVEYMVFEAAGILIPLQDKEFESTCTKTGIIFEDIEPRSTITLNLKGVEWNWGSFTTKIDESERKNFLRIAESIQKKYSQSKPSDSFEALYQIIMRDTDIEDAFKSSSIYLAAGNLQDFELTRLLILKKKLSFYEKAGGIIQIIVNLLEEKINLHIKNNFKEEEINSCQAEAENQFIAEKIFLEQERKFNALYAELEKKINELCFKGKEAEPTKLMANKSFKVIHNLDVKPQYSEVAQVAETLALSLKTARNNFFNEPTPLTVEKVQIFETACKQAIDAATDEFAKFRDGNEWYNDLNPILKGIVKAVKAIVGAFALLFFGIGAVLTEKYTKQGYHGTFFETKTDSLRELQKFQKGVCGKDGIVSELNEAANTLALG